MRTEGTACIARHVAPHPTRTPRGWEAVGGALCSEVGFAGCSQSRAALRWAARTALLQPRFTHGRQQMFAGLVATRGGTGVERESIRMACIIFWRASAAHSMDAGALAMRQQLMPVGVPPRICSNVTAFHWRWVPASLVRCMPGMSSRFMREQLLAIGVLP